MIGILSFVSIFILTSYDFSTKIISKTMLTPTKQPQNRAIHGLYYQKRS